MSNRYQLLRTDSALGSSRSLREVDFAQLGLKESDIQKWIAEHSDVLGEELLIIADEYRDFDKTRERPDLLAVDGDGNLVVIELKRDDSGEDAHWQAIRYASYLRRAGVDDIVAMYAAYKEVSEEEAKDRLRSHLDADDLDSLNHIQRIILASHRFAAGVTTAALWLNEQVTNADLITCVELTPYQDEGDGSLFLQANTIIPLPREEDYIVQIRDKKIRVGEPPSSKKGLTNKELNRSDDITKFLISAAEKSLEPLSEGNKPKKKSLHAGGWEARGEDRYYKVWHDRSPWGNWGPGLAFAMRLNLFDSQSVLAGNAARDKLDKHIKNNESVQFKVKVGMECRDVTPELRDRIEGVSVHQKKEKWKGKGENWSLVAEHASNTLNDDFANAIAGTFRVFIEKVTPVVDAFMEEEAN